MQTRRRCDEAAIDVAHDLSQPLDTARVDARREFFEQSITSLPEIAAHRHAKVLVNAGVASHHAGHLPAWKLTVEKMMSAGLLDAIFATSTVAAGVDFPARTVVIGNADTRGNDGWRPLTVNELRQMTGRAGRRGRDNVGFAVLVPGQFQDPRRISELLRSEPEPIVSRFKATYTSLLNLLDAFEDLEQVREITEKVLLSVANSSVPAAATAWHARSGSHSSAEPVSSTIWAISSSKRNVSPRTANGWPTLGSIVRS